MVTLKEWIRRLTERLSLSFLAVIVLGWFIYTCITRWRKGQRHQRQGVAVHQIETDESTTVTPISPPADGSTGPLHLLHHANNQAQSSSINHRHDSGNHTHGSNHRHESGTHGGFSNHRHESGNHAHTNSHRHEAHGRSVASGTSRTPASRSSGGTGRSQASRQPGSSGVRHAGRSERAHHHRQNTETALDERHRRHNPIENEGLIRRETLTARQPSLSTIHRGTSIDTSDDSSRMGIDAGTPPPSYESVCGDDPPSYNQVLNADCDRSRDCP